MVSFSFKSLNVQQATSVLLQILAKKYIASSKLKTDLNKRGQLKTLQDDRYAVHGK